jgi:hypothetical protein
MTKKILLALVALLALAQLVPVSRTNPPVVRDAGAPAEVSALLRRACYDCHSHETVWPAYASVAPISWLVAHDVDEGRGELNFSDWPAGDAKRLAKIARKLPEEVEEREMPPRMYLLAHPAARLSDAERARLAEWARGLAAPR